MRRYFAVAALIALACTDSKPQRAFAPHSPPHRPALHSVPVRQAEERFIGVVVSRDSQTVVSEMDGRVLSVMVRVGDAVRQGDPITAFDPELLKQDVEVARASLREAQADKQRAVVVLSEAESRLRRRLSFSDGYAKEEVAMATGARDAAAASLTAAAARVQVEEAKEEHAMAALRRTVIRAPIDGEIGVRYVEPGMAVQRGAPLVKLVSSRRLTARFAVSAVVAMELKVGQPVMIATEGRDERVSGTIERIAPEIDTPSGLVIVEAALPTGARLIHGDVVRVSRPGAPDA